MAIRGLIFDFGGVLWDMRWDLSRQLEREHGLRERAIPDTLYGTETWRKLAVGVGEREAWLREAHGDLEATAGRALPPLHQRWRERQHPIAPNVDLIRRLRPPYRTAVLSNAANTLRHRLREAGIAELFDDIVVSADVGIAKPDPSIYTLAAERLELAPEECVFIDDLESNVRAAHSVGMEGVHFRVDRGDDLRMQLEALGIALRDSAVSQ